MNALRLLLITCLVLMPGCLAMGVSQVSVLSRNETVMSTRREPLPLVAGVRVGLVNGQASAVNEQVALLDFVAKLSDAGIFQRVHYPASGLEDIMFEVGGKTIYQADLNPLSFLGIIVCGGTLFIVCPRLSSSYEYIVHVRVLQPRVNMEINRYTAVGKRRVTFGLFSVNDAHPEGWRAAITSAYDQIIVLIRGDEANYVARVDP